MTIEHNEQKIKDVTIPLFQLEQRVDRLEANFNSFQAEAVVRMTDQIAFKLNS